MTATIRLDVEIDHWINGAKRFPAEWKVHALAAVEPVMARAFDIADQRVHVITGALKRSGDYVVEEDGQEISGALIYDIDYAEFEFGRGGEHDAVTPAIVEIEDEFLEACMVSMARTFISWK